MFCNSDGYDSAIWRSPEPRSRPLVIEASYFLYSPFPLFTGVRGSGILRSWVAGRIVHSPGPGSVGCWEDEYLP
jgi:hypothetical protein